MTGQPAESASATAPQTDRRERACCPPQPQDPAAVNPAQPEPSESSPDGRPPEEQKLPPGRCSECGAPVDRGKLELVERGEVKLPYHRRPGSKHDLIGALCGPVTTRWTYQVVATVRVLVPLPVEMEHSTALVNVEALLRQGMRPQAAVVTGWNLVGID